jgi:tetratricopeptide (TPR) repeat protein
MRRIATILLSTALIAGGSTLAAAPASAQQPSERSPQADDQAANDHAANDHAANDHAANDKQRFRELGRAGSKAFADKDYEAAVEAFKQAHAIKPVPNLLYNIGRALEKQGDFEGAIVQYEKFVNEPDVELKARRDALQRLKTLREVLALREEGEEVDAEQVDREQAGEQDAREPADPNPSNGVVAADDQVVERDYTLAYIFGATGVATLIGSGVFAGLSALESSDFDEAVTLAGRRSAADTGRIYTTVADSMLITGAVFTAAGLYFWAAAPREQATERARLVPAVGPNGASMSFSLDF